MEAEVFKSVSYYQISALAHENHFIVIAALVIMPSRSNSMQVEHYYLSK